MKDGYQHIEIVVDRRDGHVLIRDENLRSTAEDAVQHAGLCNPILKEVILDKFVGVAEVPTVSLDTFRNAGSGAGCTIKHITPFGAVSYRMP